MTILALAALVLGCGKKSSRDSTPLVLEDLGDSSRLSQGEPLLTRIEPYRMENGALRIRGRLDFPDGTRIQVAIRDARDQPIGRWEMIVQDHGFDSPPILGPRGPLPEGRYRLEYLAHFTDAWQPRSVNEATDYGRRLRGPGVRLTRQGLGSFYMVEERKL